MEALRKETARTRAFVAQNPKRLNSKDQELKSSITDPDSAKMATNKGVIQGYAAQAAVDSDSQIIIRADMVGSGSKQAMLVPMIEGEGAFEIARRARGTPRIANRLLRRVRDYADMKGESLITKTIADKALAMLDVNPCGFDVMDRKLLEAVVHRFDGGPVGLDNVAAAIREDRETIEDAIQPYLIQHGYL